jgi:RimJ/RimL family protein N-acetyltransferase
MKLTLEPVEYKHLKWLRDQRNNPDLMDFCRQPFFLNEINQEDWLKDVSKNRAMLPLIVADKGLGEGRDWVGYGAFSNIDWISRRAEISYFTSHEHKDKGYAEAAVKLILAYGFYTLGFQKINTDTFAFNQREVDFMKGLGFEESGRLVRHYFKRGRLQDSILLHLLSENFAWPACVSESKPL